jgi:hypothetical protein
MEKTTSRSTAADSTPEEQPTASAVLEFSVRPVEIRGRAEGTVPAVDAPALIKTFGVIGMSVAGITGAVVILLAAPSRGTVWPFGLALAELALTTGVVITIACRDYRPAGVRGSRQAQTARRSRRGLPGRGGHSRAVHPK